MLAQYAINFMDNILKPQPRIAWASRSNFQDEIEDKGFVRELHIEGDNNGPIYTYSKVLSVEEDINFQKLPQEKVIEYVRNTLDYNVITAEIITLS